MGKTIIFILLALILLFTILTSFFFMKNHYLKNQVSNSKATIVKCFAAKYSKLNIELEKMNFEPLIAFSQFPYFDRKMNLIFRKEFENNMVMMVEVPLRFSTTGNDLSFELYRPLSIQFLKKKTEGGVWSEQFLKEIKCWKVTDTDTDTSEILADINAGFQKKW